MPRKQHIVRLTPGDRKTLTTILRTGYRSAWSIQRARLLLATDAATEGPALTDAVVAAREGVSARCVARARADWADRGIACVDRRSQRRPSTRPKFSDAQILQVAAIACTEPPPGYARWSLRLLRDRVIELEIVETVCVETVRRVLAKGGASPGALTGS